MLAIAEDQACVPGDDDLAPMGGADVNGLIRGAAKAGERAKAFGVVGAVRELDGPAGLWRAEVRGEGEGGGLFGRSAVMGHAAGGQKAEEEEGAHG